MKLRRLHDSTLLAVLLLVSSVFGQQQRMDAPPHGPLEYSLPSGIHQASVHFKLVNNHILIPVALNGQGPFDFILDTGMPDVSGILASEGDWLKEVDLHYFEGARAQIGGAGKDQSPVMAKVAEGVSLGIGDILLKGTHVVVAPPMPVAFQYYRGVIGAALFSNFVVRIDYNSDTITFTEPKYFHTPTLWTQLSMPLQQGIPRVNGILDINDIVNVAVTLVLDLGASHPVSLNTRSDQRITVPQKHLTTQIGLGMGGALTGNVARVNSLALGGLILTNVIATFPDSANQFPREADGRSGNLGNGFLHHFNVIIDYAHKQMFIKPNRYFDEPFEWRMTGLVFGEATDDGVAIVEVDDSSPASEAGILAGDVLLSINGKGARDYEFKELTKLTRTEANKLVLSLEREGKRLTVELTTRRLI